MQIRVEVKNTFPEAALTLWDLENDTSINDPILEVLNQPEDCTVFNQTVVVRMAPPQKWEVIQAFLWGSHAIYNSLVEHGAIFGLIKNLQNGVIYRRVILEIPEYESCFDF